MLNEFPRRSSLISNIDNRMSVSEDSAKSNASRSLESVKGLNYNIKKTKKARRRRKNVISLTPPTKQTTRY